MKKTNAILVLLIMSLLLVGFNDTNSNKYDEIITRHDKDDTDFIKLADKFEKYMCLLNLPDCEGTLIADQWVLSAAHCAISITEKFNNGRKHFVIINDVEIEVDKVIMYKEWESVLQGDESIFNNMASLNDIALLHLKTKPEGAMHAKLYVDEDEADKLVYIVGRGDKGDGLVGIKGNDGKQRAATNRIETATGNWLTWTFDHPNTQTKYLTEYEGISGPGDSGGPAFILKNDVVYLAGISAWQDRKGREKEGLYGVVENYTRVSQFKQWIHDEMAGTSTSSIAMSRVEVKPNATFYKPKAIAINPSILKQYVGTYETAKKTPIKVYTKENGTKFFILVAKKSEYEFIPTAKNKFSSKKHEGFNLEFKNIKNGVSKKLVLILSDGRRREAVRK